MSNKRRVALARKRGKAKAKLTSPAQEDVYFLHIYNDGAEIEKAYPQLDRPAVFAVRRGRWEYTWTANAEYHLGRELIYLAVPPPGRDWVPYDTRKSKATEWRRTIWRRLSRSRRLTGGTKPAA